MSSQPASAWSKPVLKKLLLDETTDIHSFMYLAIVVFTFKYLYIDDKKGKKYLVITLPLIRAN